MATIKAYTTIEQSRKLAEFLPLESADMCWYLATKGNPKAMFNEGYNEYGDFELPCWSLAALLGVLPQSVRLVGTPKDSYWYCECVNGNNQWYAGFGSADNPIDACYEMIIRLHSNQLL